LDWSRPPDRQLSVRGFDKVVIGGYRKFIHPVTRRVIACRYRPTCSAYGQQAVRTHGFPKGAWLTTKRIARCGPWVPNRKFDPVPPRAP
jgi:putative membrane protein insertion efficiency factor